MLYCILTRSIGRRHRWRYFWAPLRSATAATSCRRPRARNRPSFSVSSTTRNNTCDTFFFFFFYPGNGAYLFTTRRFRDGNFGCGGHLPRDRSSSFYRGFRTSEFRGKNERTKTKKTKVPGIVGRMEKSVSFSGAHRSWVTRVLAYSAAGTYCRHRRRTVPTTGGYPAPPPRRDIQTTRRIYTYCVLVVQRLSGEHKGRDVCFCLFFRARRPLISSSVINVSLSCDDPSCDPSGGVATGLCNGGGWGG